MVFLPLLVKPRYLTPDDLAQWMTWHDVNRHELAETCKVNRRTVYRWLMGQSAIPPTVAPRLMQFYGQPWPQNDKFTSFMLGQRYTLAEGIYGENLYADATGLVIEVDPPRAITKT